MPARPIVSPIVKAAAAGGGMLAGGAVALASLTVLEAVWARFVLGPGRSPTDEAPSGLFGTGYGGPPLEFAVLGDSLAVGVGAASPEQSVGVLLAKGVADAAGRPVHLHNVAVSGSESKDLAPQLKALARSQVHPDVALIVVGGNDIMHLERVRAAVAALSDAVRTLHHNGCHVVVATCPDMGTVRPFAQPLRFFVHWLSRLLATSQTIAVLRAGGRTVSLADALGPIFRQDPASMFSMDHLHPSSDGYAEAFQALLPSVCAAAGCWTRKDTTVPHRVYRKGSRHPLVWFAFRASRSPGTESRAVHGRLDHLFESGRRVLDRRPAVGLHLNGAAINGAIRNGATRLNGKVRPNAKAGPSGNATPDGGTPPGATPDGGTPPGVTPDGGTPPGATSQGATAPNDTPPGSPPPNAAATD